MGEVPDFDVSQKEEIPENYLLPVTEGNRQETWEQVSKTGKQSRNLTFHTQGGCEIPGPLGAGKYIAFLVFTISTGNDDRNIELPGSITVFCIH